MDFGHRAKRHPTSFPELTKPQINHQDYRRQVIAQVQQHWQQYSASLLADKEPTAGRSQHVTLYSASRVYPRGFRDCQRQVSSTICFKSYSAFQPSSRSAQAGSA